MKHLNIKNEQSAFGELMAYPDVDGDFAITQDSKIDGKRHMIAINKEEAKLLMQCLTEYINTP